MAFGVPAAMAATPDIFATVTQPIGVAATQNEVLVSQPYCVNDGQTGPISPSRWQILKFDPSVNPGPGNTGSLFAALPSNPDYGPAGTPGILSNCEETYLAIASGLAGGFPSGNVYATQGGHIYEFNSAGTLLRTLALIPSLEVPFAHTALVFDTVGTFGNKLIVVGTDSSNFGEIWTVDFSGNATKIFTLTGPQGGPACNGGDAPCFETSEVAPLSGPIGSAFPGSLFLPLTALSGIAADIGALSPSLAFSTPGGVPVPETIHFVPSASPACTFSTTNPNNQKTYQFFNASFSTTGSGSLGNTIYAYHPTDFNGLAGQMLVTTEGSAVLVSTDANIDYSAFDNAIYDSEGSSFVQCFSLCVCNCPVTPSKLGRDKGIGLLFR